MENISEEKLIEVFGEYDPGVPLRDFISKKLAMSFAGYSCGNPEWYYLNQLGLIDGNRYITEKGRVFLANYLLESTAAPCV